MSGMTKKELLKWLEEYPNDTVINIEVAITEKGLKKIQKEMVGYQIKGFGSLDIECQTYRSDGVFELGVTIS